MNKQFLNTIRANVNRWKQPFLRFHHDDIHEELLEIKDLLQQKEQRLRRIESILIHHAKDDMF